LNPAGSAYSPGEKAFPRAAIADDDDSFHLCRYPIEMNSALQFRASLV
jgi:hypothetical protein